MTRRSVVAGGTLVLAASAGVVFAQGPSQLQVLGTSATQAILQYQAPDANACQIQVSPNATLAPLAADVDPQLFPAANQDNRPGSGGNANNRIFVVGARRADVASDGKRYSRALQAFTQYYAQVTCNATSATVQFTTANPPLGNNFPEPPPFDATAFGNYAWPTIDWNDQSKTYIDPLTGIALKRATGPGWYGGSKTGQTFGAAIDLNNAWTNISNVLTGGASLASYTGQGGDPIFLAFDPSQLNGENGVSLSSWTPGQTFDNALVRVFGSGTGTVFGCLSADSGLNCASPVFTFATLKGSGANVAGTYPPACAGDVSKNCFPNNGFWGGWNMTPVNGQMIGVSGAVNVAGSAVTSANSSTPFNLAWKPGGKVFIAGSAPGCMNNLCTIASVTGSTTMTIQESAGTFSGAAFKTFNSGIKLWVAAGVSTLRPTGEGAQVTGRGPGNTTVNVKVSVNYDYAYSQEMTMPLNGTVAQCSPNPTTVSYAADGVTPISPVQGELCLAAFNVNPGKVLYLLIPSTGETRLLSPMWFVNTNDVAADQEVDPVAGSVQIPNAAFDATDPNTIYAQVPTQGGISIFRGVYNAATYKYKAYAHSLYPSITASYLAGEDTTKNWYRGPAWADSGITWTNITKATQKLDLGSQIAAGDPSYDGKLFYGPTVTEIGGGRAFTANIPRTNASGESLTLIHSFDLSTGKLVQSADTWSKFPSRWCAMHSNVDLNGWYGLICNPLGGIFGFKGSAGVMGLGPWQITPTAMLKNGQITQDTSMTSTAPLDACPAIPAILQNFAPANPRCVTFQSPMPCSLTPYPGENVKWPCEYNPNYSELQPLAPGDQIMISTTGEMLLILTVGSSGNSSYQFTAIRGATNNVGAGGFTTPASAWTAYAVPTGAQCGASASNGCTPGVGMWFDGAQSTVNWQLDPGAFSAHSDLGNAPAAGSSSYCQTQSCRFNVPFSRQIGQSPTSVFQPGSFAGVGGEIALQGYPSLHQLTAPPAEQVWMLNYRHLNPSYGAGAEVQSAVGAVSYSLVPGTQGVFKFTSINGGLSYKAVPVEGYAGFHLLRDVSSPQLGNTISDATPWQFCVVLNAGECQAGSKPGEAYASVPQGLVHSSQNCIANWYDDNFPCLFTPPAQAAWGIQQGISQNDPNGQFWRPITMGFSGPGRQFEFGSFIPDPTGTWGFTQAYWPDGARNDLFIARLPPWPKSSDGINRSNFVPLAVTVPANSAQPFARVHFGYAENGSSGSFFCTARKDACNAVGAPFTFDSESPQWQNCSSACTIQVPEIAGRVLYYEIDRRDAAGNITSGPVQANIIP